LALQFVRIDIEKKSRPIKKTHVHVLQIVKEPGTFAFPFLKK